MSSVIEFRNVSKAYGKQPVVTNLNLNINKGEIFVLVGSSGSGKTTTLKMINRLINPDKGEILINGQPNDACSIIKLRWMIGYVLQQIALFPTMTIAQNVAVIPELKHVNPNQIAKMVTKLLADVGLDDSYQSRMPNELSGGEQQRVGIIRAMAGNPEVLLMDEPFSAVDPITKTNLQQLVLNLQQKYHQTIVFVTHDIDEAIKLGDRIGVMSKGKLLQVGTAQQLLQHPVNEFVKAFFNNSATNVSRDRVLNLINNNCVQTGNFALDNATATVTESDYLQTVINLLTSHKAIFITDDQHQIIGKITNQEVIKYLSLT